MGHIAQPARNQEIRNLYAEGNLSLSEIGAQFNISKQRVEQIIKAHSHKRTYKRTPNRKGAQSTYTFIVQHMVENHGLPPSIREIAEGVGIPSTSTVSYYLRQLEQENKIAFNGVGKSRSLYIPGATWTPPK